MRTNGNLNIKEIKVKKVINFKLILGTIMLIFIADVSNAKEVELILEANTQYPLNLHYAFLINKITYEGYFNSMQNKEIQYISVNRVPDNDQILIKIDKINVVNRTVFNDPCEIKLDNNELTAKIIVGFQGDPTTHGSFKCFISKS
jgi:hypothetical protein